MLRCWHQGSEPVLGELQEVGESCDVVQQQTDRLCPVAVQMRQQDDDWVKKENSHLTAYLCDICSSRTHVNTPLYYTQTAYCRRRQSRSYCWGVRLWIILRNRPEWQSDPNTLSAKTAVLGFSLLSVTMDGRRKGTGLSFDHFDHMTHSQGKWSQTSKQ